MVHHALPAHVNHFHAGDLPHDEQLARVLAAEKTPLSGIVFVELVAFFIEILALHRFPHKPQKSIIDVCVLATASNRICVPSPLIPAQGKIRLIRRYWRVIIQRRSEKIPLEVKRVKRHWSFLESRVAYQNRIVQVQEDTYHFIPNDIVRDFTVLGFSDWVNIIPVTPEGKVVMIRQYRLGTRSETLEIPGGLISEEDADPAEAALREMIEETGYYSGEVVHIGTVEPNPAIQNNRCHTFLARNAVPVSSQNLDSTEAIMVELVQREDIPVLVRTSRITHGLVLAAFAYLMIHETSSNP